MPFAPSMPPGSHRCAPMSAASFRLRKSPHCEDDLMSGEWFLRRIFAWYGLLFCLTIDIIYHFSMLLMRTDPAARSAGSAAFLLLDLLFRNTQSTISALRRVSIWLQPKIIFQTGGKRFFAAWVIAMIAAKRIEAVKEISGQCSGFGL